MVGGPETISEQKTSAPTRTGSFDDLFLETTGEALRQVFGEKVAETILQRVLNSSRGENPNRVKGFSDALPKILGSGAVPVERLILKHLYAKFELNLQQKYGYDFMDYIEELKQVSKGKQEHSDNSEESVGEPMTTTLGDGRT